MFRSRAASPPGSSQEESHLAHHPKPRSLRQQSTLLFCLLFFCYAYVHQGRGWNQDSRLDLLHVVFREGMLRIDTFHENTGDKSIHNGHYYIDKAPGIAFLAAPACALSLAILKGCGVSPDSPQGWLASSWITTAGSVGWITALGGVAMFAFLTRLVGRRYAFITVLAVFLGSAVSLRHHAVQPRRRHWPAVHRPLGYRGPNLACA